MTGLYARLITLKNKTMNEPNKNGIIANVIVPLPTVEDFKFWYAPNSVKNLDGTMTNEDWISEDDKENFELFEEFMNEWITYCNER
jgi:hypothetical protein